jgi:FkbM family methyltransferase
MSIVALKLSLKRLLKRAGLELRKLENVNSEETVLQHLLDLMQPTAVLDVGANTGQFARLLREVGYRGLIVSFEAIPDVHSVLSAGTNGDPMWVIAPCAALGSAPGELQINVSKNSVSSSMLPMRKLHVAAAPDSVYVGTRTVRVARLDELAPPLVPEGARLFLKIDTQGYEKEVLLGATGLLEHARVVQVEMSLLQLYEGAPTFTEMLSYLESLGYQLFSLVPGFRNVRSGRLLQADGFFVRE